MLQEETVVSYNHPFYTAHNRYAHYYTGAFISPGYPVQGSDNNYGVIYDMFFGGLPYHTYTTIRLHSSPSLLSGSSLQMSNGYVGDWSYLGFSGNLSTPISVFTAEHNIININIKRDSSADLDPAFLFSFEGKRINCRKLHALISKTRFQKDGTTMTQDIHIIFPK